VLLTRGKTIKFLGAHVMCVWRVSRRLAVRPIYYYYKRMAACAITAAGLYNSLPVIPYTTASINPGIGIRKISVLLYVII